MEPEEVDRQVRLTVFNFLADQTEKHGDALPRVVLSAGCTFNGQRVPIVGPQGIFKPAAIPTGIPLSITTVPSIEGRPRPYEDEVSPLVKDNENALLDYLATLVAKEYVVYNNPRAGGEEVAEEMVRMLVRVRRHVPVRLR